MYHRNKRRAKAIRILNLAIGRCYWRSHTVQMALQKFHGITGHGAEPKKPKSEIRRHSWNHPMNRIVVKRVARSIRKTDIPKEAPDQGQPRRRKG